MVAIIKSKKISTPTSSPQSLKKIFKKNEDTYRAFCQAVAAGDLNEVQELGKEVPQLLDMIKKNNCKVFRDAISQGHLEIVRYFKKKLPLDQLLLIIKHDDNELLLSAAASGHLNILKSLEKLAPNELLVMIKAKDYWCIQEVAENGHLEMLEYLEKKLSKEERQEMIQRVGPIAFTLAAHGGHLPVLRHLVDSVAKSQQMLQKMIRYDDCEAYCSAARNNHLAILHYLEQQAPDAVSDMIKAKDFQAFRKAAFNGHLGILQHLEKQAPDMMTAMLQARDFEAFRTAPSDIREYLLHYEVVFSYAEEHYYDHGPNYSHYIDRYVDNLLNNLRKQKMQWAEKNPKDIFDVPEAQAKQFFYCLRNLIRRGNTVPKADLLLLLETPSVKAIVHEPVTANRPNELLRFAYSIQNTQAEELLLAIPDVKKLADENANYRSERQDGIHAATLAQEPESAMIALTPCEQKSLEKIQNHYKAAITASKIPDLMDELKAMLAARYNKNPACIMIKGKIIKLPLEWTDFQSLSLQDAERNAALKAYYKHKDHTALRYISKPNYWMHNNAGYTNANHHREQWSTFDAYQSFIALFYVAAKDEAIPPTDGFTIDSRLTHFINELAYLGRVHNWDRSRVKGNKTEEYDDLEGDRPSCFSGVKRRLFQSLLGHPLYVLLNAERIKDELRSFARDHFKELIKFENCHELKTAWDKVCATGSAGEHLATLKKLDISDEKQEAFIRQLELKYGEQFSANDSLKHQIKAFFKLDVKSSHLGSLFEPTQWKQFLDSRLMKLKFLELLCDLEDKKKYLAFYLNVDEIINPMLDAIKKRADDFYQLTNPSKKEIQKFKKDCINILQKNTAALQEHRAFLGAVFATINHFFIALSALLFNFSLSHRFFDGRTNSAKILHKLEENINNFPINPVQ